jgi:hypothetical protein
LWSDTNKVEHEWPEGLKKMNKILVIQLTTASISITFVQMTNFQGGRGFGFDFTKRLRRTLRIVRAQLV